MDRYFQCLIRRVSGEFHKHTVQPHIRIRGNFYYPFENTAVRPLQYPESRTSRTHAPEDQKDTTKEKGSSERKLQKISEHKIPAIGPPEVSPKTSLKRVDTERISSATNYKNIKQLKSKPTINSDPTQTKRKITKQQIEENDTHISLQNIEPPITESVKQEIEPTGTRNSNKVAGQTYLKTIAAKSKKPSTAVDQPFRRTEEKTGDVERSIVKHANPYVTPKRVEPIPQRSFTISKPSLSKRRSATRVGKKNRLSIGNLVVDVVPVSETSHRRSSSRVRKTKVQKQSKNSLSRHTANLRFGLGQM
jgi:hypothetical protein